MNVTFIFDISRLVFEELETVRDELPAQEPLDESNVEDNVDKVECIT